MHDQRCIFIRHAHRPEFAPGDLGNEVSITQEGRAAIERFSQSLTSCPARVFTSPVKRCMETAQELCKTLQVEIPIVSSTLLGDPGFLISDPLQAFTVFNRHSVSEILRFFLTSAI